MGYEFAERYFPKATKAVNEGKCPICRKEIWEGEFRDELSNKEYMISGMCQKCQDETFNME